MKSFIAYYSLLFIVFLSCGLGEKPLPIFGEHTVVRQPFDAYKVGDTVYHTVPYFEMLDQDSLVFSSFDLHDQLYLANFFFCTCPTICPTMMNKMNSFLQGLGDPDLPLLSFSVDPAHDTPQVLREFIQKHNLQTGNNWHLLTGEKNTIYDLARRGYLLVSGEDAQAEGGFIHSTEVVLIDRQARIRGSYDTASDIALKQLKRDIQQLKQEYAKN